jgi:ribosomal subunit interface protein
MAQKIETTARNMRLTDNTREYVEKKAAKLERYLQEIDEVRIELSHIKSARSAQDRSRRRPLCCGSGQHGRNARG